MFRYTLLQNFREEMSKINVNSCAASDRCTCWNDVNIKKAIHHVIKLQRRIALAYLNGNINKVAMLQHTLIHSFYAKALAVHIVTSNRGNSTPGIDGIVWNTPEDKFQAIFTLNRRGYTPKPLRRIYIPKSCGGRRPLSIPTLKDRAMQTLYKFALDPIAEISGDDCSFGFRVDRGPQKAVIQCGRILLQNPSFCWVLKVDIKSCFDNISHKWILDHIPMDKVMLTKFLKCGYIDNSVFHRTDKGVPQGSCLSSVICNMTLDGLEATLFDEFGSSVRLVRYADDICLMGAHKATLVQSVIPLIESFLAERGLHLSAEKTSVYNVEDGFAFLGFRIQKRSDDEIILSPTRKNIDSLTKKIHKILGAEDCTQSMYLESIIYTLRGWLGYYRGLVANEILNSVGDELYSSLIQYDEYYWIAVQIKVLVSQILLNQYGKEEKVSSSDYMDYNPVVLLGYAKNNIVEVKQSGKPLPLEFIDKLSLAYQLLDQVQQYVFEN